MSAAIHPDVPRLTAYMLGKLPLDHYKDVESHLSGCKTCRAKAETLEGNTDTFLNCLRKAPRESIQDPLVETLIASAKGLIGTTLQLPPKSSKMVAGHEVLHELARNGMGVIYLARHPLLDDYRAIKRPLVKDDLDRGMIMARFRREVQVGNLKHDHIIRAHDAGEDEEGPYLVMEYIDGVSLAGLLETKGSLPVAAACELIRQAALGLQVAYERGLVHRDIKPSNLMLGRTHSGVRCVVIDWGLVKRTEEQRADSTPSKELTMAQSGMGTPDYMAPEQFNDAHAVDIRADIYSLGVTLYWPDVSQR